MLSECSGRAIAQTVRFPAKHPRPTSSTPITNVPSDQQFRSMSSGAVLFEIEEAEEDVFGFFFGGGGSVVVL